MNAAQRNRQAALLKATGYEDGPALTMQSGDGEIPQGRELSFAWLTGTVLTGLTSVLLMGAALYVSFQGQDTFSTAYRALNLMVDTEEAAPAILVKTNRVKPVARTRSELEVVEASIRENVDGRDMIRKQPFSRLRATLATAGTSLSSDIPAYDPVALISAGQPIEDDSDREINTDIYGAEVEGEVAVRLAALPGNYIPPKAIDDRTASEFARISVSDIFVGGDGPDLAYADPNVSGIRELGIVTAGGLIEGAAENLTVLPKTTPADKVGLGRTERIVTVREDTTLDNVLHRNGFSDVSVNAVTAALNNIYPSSRLRSGARLRILFGPTPAGDALIPHRVSLYAHDQRNDRDVHAATVALTDSGQYVLGIAPAEIEFPDEDTEEIDVANLPTIYRSIWETGRKHDLPDAMIERIVAMYAYDVDLAKKVAAGDSIEILRSSPDAGGRQELLYVGLNLGGTKRELFRFRTEDGVVDYYDPDGETGKRFLTRRPLQGGGRISSNYGYRVHPIFKTRNLHSGVDLAAPRNTPIYAAGDGVVERAQWVSGYGRYVELKHVNGFETGYGHMNKIADGMKPGVRVRQGQVIGYVGSTGNSTGNHLHFEIKVNGRTVDPLSVKLPRDKVLPQQYQREFEETIAQIRDLMERDASPIDNPVTIASAD